MSHYLFIFDFDNTIAETFQKLPGIISIEDAYEQAIADIFGQKGLNTYLNMGGLKNRAPSEIVYELLQDKSKMNLINSAKTYFTKNVQQLTLVIPQDKGVSLVWDNESPEKVIIEMVVRQKLIKLLPQIKKSSSPPPNYLWPKPCKGFLHFWQTIQYLKKRHFNFELSIISSGHEIFIRKVFDLWEVPQPDIIVTEDDTRNLDLSSRIKVKPFPLPLVLVYGMWEEQQREKHFQIDRRYVVYFGDDIIKDGELAEIQGIAFGFFDHDQKGVKLPNVPNTFLFKDWSKIGYILKNNIYMLKEGRPIHQIITSTIV